MSRSVAATLLLSAVVALLGGCASAPRASRGASGDGPGANPPPNLAQIADAQPRLEAIRNGGPNKPYQALGRDYVPLTGDTSFSEHGLASWYGRAFQGKRTASGEPYDMYAMTAAHPTLPIPSYARIRNPANGREVVVRINDRGPFHAGRIVDLSYAAALRLDLLRGVAPVELDRITFDEIRAGTWRRPGDEAARVAAASRPAPVAATDVAVAAPAPMSEPTLPVVSAALRPATPSAKEPSRGFWVQLGAFREAGGAEGFERRVAVEVAWLGPLLATFADAALYRVQAGPFASRDEAQGAAARIREALGLVPMIVERR